jgi:transglutaminase-like putative cysteine protease
MHEGIGVCCDLADLAITLCRCIDIPARYCTDYLGDIGVAVDTNPMDFSAWAEVFLDGRWYIIDARATTIPASGVLSWTVAVTPRTSRYRPLWDRQACAL